MAEANKQEKLGFVRLYNAHLPLAAVEIQNPSALKGIGTIRYDIGLVYVAHYCWEAGLLLVSQHIDEAPLGWIDREHVNAAMSSHACATETAAVDRIVQMKGEAWVHAHGRVVSAIIKHKPLRVIHYDADGVIQEDPEEHDVTFRGDPTTLPEPLRKIDSGKGAEPSVTMSAGGKSVTLKNTDIGTLTRALGKVANGRKVVVEQPEGVIFHSAKTDKEGWVTVQYVDREILMTEAEFKALPKKAQRIKREGR